MGYSLYDREATIIHHFAFFRNPSQFHYPFLKAGVSFSIPLLNRSVIYYTLSRINSLTCKAQSIWLSILDILTNWFTIFHLSHKSITNTIIINYSKYLPLFRLVNHLSLSSQQPNMLTDFTIDAAHELALFIWNVDKNLVLKSVPYFCSRYGLKCAIYAKEENIFCVST